MAQADEDSEFTCPPSSSLPTRKKIIDVTIAVSLIFLLMALLIYSKNQAEGMIMIIVVVGLAAFILLSPNKIVQYQITDQKIQEYELAWNNNQISKRLISEIEYKDIISCSIRMGFSGGRGSVRYKVADIKSDNKLISLKLPYWPDTCEKFIEKLKARPDKLAQTYR